MARAFCSLQLPVWLTLLHHVGLFGQLWASDLAAAWPIPPPSDRIMLFTYQLQFGQTVFIAGL